MSSRTVLIGSWAAMCLVLASSSGFAQEPTAHASAAQTSVGGPVGESASSSDNPGQRTWLVRDPTTGRLFQQELVTRTVPTTQWEVRPVPTTVYEPKQVATTVPSQQTTYTPTTQYVMQPRVKGWWNPFAQPVQAYEFVPVTYWQPHTQTVQQTVTTTQWVAKQHMVYVPQAVQRNQTQQQIVSREIPQPYGGYPPGSLPRTTQPPGTLLATPHNPMLTPPLVTMPLLARQPSTPWNASTWASGANRPAAANAASGSSFSNGLRPITTPFSPAYSAPLQTASSASSQVARDPIQSGMSATVLR